MDKQSFIELLEKYLRGDATEEEQQFIVNYYNLFQNEPDVMARLSEGKKLEIKEQTEKAIWENITRQERIEQVPLPVIGRQGAGWRGKRIMMAAAGVLAIVLSAWFFSRPAVSPKQEAMVAGGQDAPKRENHLVSLPDGSTVVLSYGSRLDYPSSFDGLGKREVYLEGQAYFDIRSNASRSFVVHTGKLATTVLGTSFNIKAFPGETNITVTVKTGAVQVSDEHSTIGIIRPSQQIVYDKEKAHSLQQAVGDESYLAWKKRDLLFDNLTVEEATKLLEERFHVKILIQDPSIGSKRFTTTFSSNESLEEALESICVFNGAAFNYDQKKAQVLITRL